jgi:CubicO group peptidase (beta-lactamase class C family)
VTGSLPQPGLDRLQQAMAARVARGELPGLVTLVAHGADVHVDTIGVRAFGSDDPMRRDTIFRIASMTKPILAAAAMMLVEDGRLARDEPVDRLLPELADRQVLTNGTPGWGYCCKDPWCLDNARHKPDHRSPSDRQYG